MKKIVAVIVLSLMAIICLGQGNDLDKGEKFSAESILSPVDPGVSFGNCRYLHSVPTVFKKKEGSVPGLGENALVAKCYSYCIALNKPGVISKSGQTRYSELLVNIKGEMSFDKSSPFVILFNTSGEIESKTINNKDYSFGKSISGWCSIEGGKQYCSVVPVYEASLNIGGKDVKLVATSLDGDLDFDPVLDKLVIHEPRKAGDYYRSIKVYSVNIGKPFLFGAEGDKSWFVLKWNKEKNAISVEKSQVAMGLITAKVDWDVTLKPGDISLSGKAGEKVEVPEGKYDIYSLSGHYGDACISEFDYHLCKEKGASKKMPAIVIKNKKVTVLKPTEKFQTWFEYGWYKNELGVVLGFQNSHGAGNMFIQSKGEQVKWSYELVEKETGEVVCKGDMHFGWHGKSDCIMLVQKSMLGKKLIFRLTNSIKEIGNVKVKGREFELIMPAPEDQMKERLRGACGGILKVKK